MQRKSAQVPAEGRVSGRSAYRTAKGTQPAGRQVCLKVQPGRVAYESAYAWQWQVIEARRTGDLEDDVLFLLEHPPTITLGTQAQPAELLASKDCLAQQGVDVVRIRRGGRITFHGPGQLVGYPVLDLKVHGRDLHRYLRLLEEVLILALDHFGIEAGRQEGKTGVWVGRHKIASIGIQATRWMSLHGFALNVNPDLSYFNLIVPCGLSGDIMTSMSREGASGVTVAQVADQVGTCFARVFNVTVKNTDPTGFVASLGQYPTRKPEPVSVP